MTWQALTNSALSGFPDERLKLLFVCAHPAIDPAAAAYPVRVPSVLAKRMDPKHGLAVLDGIDLYAVSGYQPYWAVRAHLLQRLGKTSEAVGAFDRAIGLAEDPAVKQFLLQRRD